MSSASDEESFYSPPDTPPRSNKHHHTAKVGIPSPQTSDVAARQNSEPSRSLPLLNPSRIHKYKEKGRYNDAYRELFNEQVEAAATRFERDKNWQYFKKHVGASFWSSSEQATFFAALERLGRNDLPGIVAAVGTKSIPEIQEYLLYLQDAAAKQGNAKLTLRDIPAAFEVGEECNEHLDLAGHALAKFQETFEAKQEQEKFGDYWLITSDLAEDFENALDPLRADIAPSGVGGKRIAGSCNSCKQLKAKCDRNTPCGNCVKRNVSACVYKEPPTKPEQSDPPQSSTAVDKDLLQAIPEANLLRADAMLTLSRDVFMNRSPALPSPWGNWSEYTSEFANEPAIYRSAFNDLHTLIVSVTKRLTHTAIVQATSRLRSQRLRTSKGVQPWVKQRDVLAAIDILRMKRNGRKRWVGVAQRCSLEVCVGRMDRGGKARRTLSWDEVERFLKGGPEPLLEPPKSDMQISLPVEQPDLSNSDVHSDSADDSGSISADSEKLVDGERRTPSRQLMSQSRDQSGRFSNASPGESKRTLEEFDQETSQKEEQALWEMLRILPRSKEKSTRPIKDGEKTSGDDEKIITDVDEWRVWTDYKAEWEEFHHPVPRSKRKPSHSASARNSTGSHVTESSSEEGLNERSRRRRIFEDVELGAPGTLVNTALERVSISSDEDQVPGNSISDSESAEGEASNQSTKDNNQILEASDPEPEMDWEP